MIDHSTSLTVNIPYNKMRHVHKLLMALGLVMVLLGRPAAAANSLVWNTTTDRVDADLRGQPLWPFLEDLAHKTGWHILFRVQQRYPHLDARSLLARNSVVYDRKQHSVDPGRGQ